MDFNAYNVFQEHMRNYAIQTNKAGYFMGSKQDVIFAAYGTSATDARWCIHYKKSTSYVSPELYDLIYASIGDYLVGQTLPDGTVYSREKAVNIMEAVPVTDEGVDIIHKPTKPKTRKRKPRLLNDPTKVKRARSGTSRNTSEPPILTRDEVQHDEEDNWSNRFDDLYSDNYEDQIEVSWA